MYHLMFGVMYNVTTSVKDAATGIELPTATENKYVLNTLEAVKQSQRMFFQTELKRFNTEIKNDQEGSFGTLGGYFECETVNGLILSFHYEVSEQLGITLTREECAALLDLFHTSIIPLTDVQTKLFSRLTQLYSDNVYSI